MAAASIRTLNHMPDGINNLVAQSEEEGYQFINRLVTEWSSGVNSFNRFGEVLFGAYYTTSLVGVCGINQDPYTQMVGVGRLRHLYIDPNYRTKGVGRLLVSTCLKHAESHLFFLRDFGLGFRADVISHFRLMCCGLVVLG